MTPEPRPDLPRWVWASLLVVLEVFLTSSLVLAASWAVDFPEPVLAAAWDVAAVAAGLVVIGAWVAARRSGLGVRSVGRVLRALVTFIFDFF